MKANRVKTMRVDIVDGKAVMTVTEVEEVEVEKIGSSSWGCKNPKNYAQGDTLIIDEKGTRWIDPEGNDVTHNYPVNNEVLEQAFGKPILDAIKE